jgi:hypothetical protein
VRRFGRNGDFGFDRRRTGNGRSKGKADPCGMTTRKTNATATARAKTTTTAEADPCGMTTEKQMQRRRQGQQHRQQQKQIPAGCQQEKQM